MAGSASPNRAPVASQARRLRVLFLAAWYPTPDRPLNATFVRECARAVQLYDDLVVLHAPGLNPQLGPLWQMVAEEDPVITQGLATYRVQHRLPAVPLTANIVHIWSVLQAYRRLAAGGFRPDVIHAHVYQAGFPAVFLGKALGLPVVITEHYTAFHTGTLARGERLKARLAFRWADRVLPVSCALQKAIEAQGLRARFTVMPNVVDTSRFFPAARPAAPGRLKRILFVGALAPAKGMPYLLAALAGLAAERADWQLEVVGAGPYREAYERQAGELGLSGKVIFYGPRPPDEVAELMRGVDFLVSASIVETFSVVAAEALASGIPVLATRSGGPEEFVNEQVGLVVPPGDTGELRRGLAYMLDHLDCFAAEDIARYARERFSPEAVGTRLHQLYLSLVQA